MCAIENNGIHHQHGNDDTICGGGRPLLPESTEYVLVSLGLSPKFIGIWIQYFNSNYLHQTTYHL